MGETGPSRTTALLSLDFPAGPRGRGDVLRRRTLRRLSQPAPEPVTVAGRQTGPRRSGRSADASDARLLRRSDPVGGAPIEDRRGGDQHPFGDDVLSVAGAERRTEASQPVWRRSGLRARLLAGEPDEIDHVNVCLLYTSPSPRDRTRSRMPSSA